MSNDTKKRKIPVINIVLIALFAAITAVFSQLAIPLPSGVPVTLQTFSVALCGYYLGTKKGTIAIAVYILLGAVGVPVFSNMKGGFVCIVSVTGGFIWGFLALAALSGINPKFRPLSVATGIAGLLICHICGFVQYAFLNGIDIIKSFLTVSFPFLLKDVISVIAAFAVAEILKKATAKLMPANI